MAETMIDPEDIVGPHAYQPVICERYGCKPGAHPITEPAHV